MKCEIVKKHIDKWDPIDLLAFTPPDEYDWLSEVITNLITEWEVKETLGETIYKVFLNAFDETFEKSEEECIIVAEKILIDIRKRPYIIFGQLTRRNNKIKEIKKDILELTPLEYRAQLIFRYILDNKLNLAKNDEEYEQVIVMKKGYQIIYTMEHLIGEVNNGGYWQLIDNYERNNNVVEPYYNLIIKYLKFLGSESIAKDFSDVLKLYNNRDSYLSDDMSKELDRQLTKYDNNFIDNQGELIDAINSYIEDNLDEFVS